ncbi:Kelch motif protein [Dysgonomonas alginatilytica]|uniref:Kelch motif protein n=1 Tax=Dysgonomonas alginatilytica TaxID=1605892 RepID=A0A2V3PM30_9BACT|nr:hypothetical protein [Dysgonomonas alginatilytica]PXV62475.1 Kelch motif protein [Dysgonomonas alginatilytica]
MRVLLTLLLIYSICTITAQEKMQVVDGVFRTPMAGVSVSFNKIGVTTDNDGFFSEQEFSSLSEQDSLTFSFLGYNTKIVSLSELRKSKIVYMLPKSESLAEVTVVGDRTYLQESIQFEKLAPLKNGVFAFGAALVGNKIYLIGGDSSVRNELFDYYRWEYSSNKLQIYDINSDTWYSSDLQFSKRAYHNIHYYEGKIYILGGKKLAKNPKLEYLNDEVEVYDIEHNTISSSKTNPHPAVNFASSVFQDNLIVMGGSIKKNNNGKKLTNKVHLFNLETGYWYELDDMAYFKETKSIVVDSILYQIGGFSKAPIRYINTYNISTGEYKMVRKLPHGLERPALAYNEGVIYIYEHDLLFTYEVESGKMYAYRINLDLMYSEMVCKDGILYIIGGLEYVENLRMPSDNLYSIDVDELQKTKSYFVPDFQ